MKRLLLVACLTVFGYSFATAEDYTPGNLTGAWEGTPPMGGKLFINIEVSPGGDIKVKGDISERWFPNVFGKVDGTPGSGVLDSRNSRALGKKTMDTASLLCGTG